MRLNACASEDTWGVEVVEATQDTTIAHLCVDRMVNVRGSSEQAEYEGSQMAPLTSQTSLGWEAGAVL